MLIYTINRLLQLIPVVLILTVVVFGFVQALPGDIIDSLAGQDTVEDPQVRAALEKEYGLDQPIYVQFGLYVARVLQGDFGQSIRFSRPVSQILVERLPMTIELAIGGLVLGEVTTERVVHHLRVGEEAGAEEPAGHPGAVA